MSGNTNQSKGAAGAAAASADQQQPAGAQVSPGAAAADEAGSVLAEGGDGAAAGAGQSAAGADAKSGAAEGAGSVLAEGGNGEPELKEPTPDEVKAFLGKIKQVDMSRDDGSPAPAWDDAAVAAVAPLMLKHGVSEAAANEIIGAYAQHVSAQYAAAMEADRQVLAGLRSECQQRFGQDLKRFAAEGRRGGEHVFGRELFARLARVEAFGSDPDIIEALAKVGRTLARDSAPGDSARQEERDLARRMYPTM